MDSDNYTMKDLRESTLDLEEALKVLIWEWEDKYDLTITDIALGRDMENKEVTNTNVIFFSPFERDV